MLEIRLDQLELFVDQVREGFTTRATAYLRQHHAESVREMDDLVLRQYVKRQIETAESHGILTEAPVVKFIGICLRFGEGFHSSGNFPVAERILAQQTDGVTKVEELLLAAESGFAEREAL